MNVKSSAELRRELEAAETREREAAKAAKWKCPPKYAMWIKPAEAKTSHDKLFDPTCMRYEIKRMIVNADAARAAGWDGDDLKEGSAVYIYNAVTRRIVCAVGGGVHYITNNSPFGREDFADDAAFYKIGEYLAQYPGGGDITEIYDDFRIVRRSTNKEAS